MKNKKGLLLIYGGLLLMAAALLLTSYNLWEARQAGASVVHVAEKMDKILNDETEAEIRTEEERALYAEQEIPDYILNPDMEMPTKHIDGQDYIGILYIPDLNLELPVISDWSYPQLRIAPCRYKGSVYSGDLIIAAHNYSAHFGHLQALTEGSRISFTDVDGNQFEYEVIVRETLLPENTEEMESGEWDLTLFTCTLGGQYRVTVRCKKTENMIR